jgi:hypothetical protein
MVMNTSSVIRVEDGTKTKRDYDFPDTEVLSVQVSGAFHPFVSFDEPTVDPGVLAFPVADLLETCLDRVQQFIIPEFTESLK